MGKYVSLGIAILVSLVVLVVLLILAIRGCGRTPLPEQKPKQPKSTTEGATGQNGQDGKEGSKQPAGQPPESGQPDTYGEGDGGGRADLQQDAGQGDSEQESSSGGGGLPGQGKSGPEAPDSSQSPANGGQSGSSGKSNGNGEGKPKFDASQAAAAWERAERLRRRAEQSAQRGNYGRAYAEALQAWEMLRPAAKYDPQCRNLMDQLEGMLRRYGDLANQDYRPRPLDDKPLATQNK